MCHAQSTYQIGMSTSLPCLLKLTFYRMSSESGGGGWGWGGGGGWREVQAYKVAPEVIKFHVTNYSILVSLLISQKLF